jgi:transposase-like protein
MPQRGSTDSPYSLQERKEMARTLFVRGSSVRDVMEALQVSEDTARRYRKAYEDEIKEQAENNPQMLRQVLDNTIRSLEELEEVRREAWLRFESAVNDNARTGYLNTLLKAQKQKADLFGLLGVKQEYMIYVNAVKAVQDKILQFLAENLCDADRQALEHFLTTELAPFMQPALPEVVDISPIQVGN